MVRDQKIWFVNKNMVRKQKYGSQTKIWFVNKNMVSKQKSMVRKQKYGS